MVPLRGERMPKYGRSADSSCHGRVARCCSGSGRNARAGVPRWTDADRSLEDTDVVLWYTFGVTHFVRPEDWPVMPVEYTGFVLMPVGFFDRNPALDVAPSSSDGSCHA